MGPIGVIGGTGTVGEPAVRQLLAMGYRPIILSRKPEVLPFACHECELEARKFDLNDLPASAVALDGIQRLLVIANPRAEGPHTEVALAAAAAGKRIDRVVRISVVGADQNSISPVRRWHGLAESAWAKSGIPTLSLRANFFMQSLLKFAPGIARKKVLEAPAATGAVAFTDASDLSACAAAALCMQSAISGYADVTSREAQTFSDVARVLSKVTGDAVIFRATTREAFVERLLRQPEMSDARAQMLAAIWDDIESGSCASIGHATEQLLGMPGGSLRAFLEQHKTAFQSLTQVSATA